jgi:hypothetical protein
MQALASGRLFFRVGRQHLPLPGTLGRFDTMVRALRPAAPRWTVTLGWAEPSPTVRE